MTDFPRSNEMFLLLTPLLASNNAIRFIFEVCTNNFWSPTKRVSTRKIFSNLHLSPLTVWILHMFDFQFKVIPTLQPLICPQTHVTFGSILSPVSNFWALMMGTNKYATRLKMALMDHYRWRNFILSTLGSFLPSIFSQIGEGEIKIFHEV